MTASLLVRRREVALLGALAVVCLCLGGCGGGSSAVAKPGRVAVVVMENREYSEVMGNPDAPYINSLASAYAVADRYFGVAHPSLPNYIAILAGSTLGIHSDCTGCHVGATSLVDELETAGISWRGYMEGMPAPCYKGATAGRGYAKRHNPFMYFDRVANSPKRCFKVRTFADLRRALSRGSLPRFSWITPNLCNDMHDCSLADGDRFLSRLIPSVLDRLGPKGVLFLTWDEGDTNSGCCTKAHGGHIVTIAAGKGARRGARSKVPYGHYSLLRTIEQMWHLPELRNASCSCTRAMTDLIKVGNG